MNQSKNCTAIKSLLLAAYLLTVAPAHAAPAVGTIVNVSGPLLVQKADGTAKVLAQHSAVEAGDTLLTQKNGYAQIKLGDDSLLVLQPETKLSIDQFTYDAAKPENDKASFTLTRGGVRATAGQLGKRSKDRVVLNTPLASVQMQNASAIVQYREADAQAVAALRSFLLASTAALDQSLIGTRSDAPMPAAISPMLLAQLPAPPRPTSSIPPGLYVNVLDGLITVSNKGGTTNFSAGQFGFTPSVVVPPVIIPQNPGLLFVPPPSFSSSSIPGPTTSTKSNVIDCEVR
jgi:hypothetical protein